MMDNIKNDELYKKLIENKNIFSEILAECGNRFHPGGGSYLFDGKNYEYYFGMYEKQKLLFDLVKNCESVLEIGTYMGHSAFIMLLSNPNIKITTIDIDDTFSSPSINVLNKNFKSDIKFIKGNSLDVLPSINEKFDLIHIDGSHDESVITKEFEMCQKFMKDTYKVVFDDIVSMSNLEQTILSNYNVISYIKPKCDWTNCYMEIKIN